MGIILLRDYQILLEKELLIFILFIIFFIPDLSFMFPYLNCKQEITLEILLALSVSIVIMAFCLIVSFVLRSNRLTGLCILGIIKK